MVLAVELVLLAVTGAQAARLIWIVAAPPIMVAARPAAVSPKSLVDLGVLASFDAFGVAGAGSGARSGQEFRLFGVRTGGADGGSAIIAGADGVQKSYAVGEPIEDGVILAAVAADHVELARGAARSTLSFPEIQ